MRWFSYSKIQQARKCQTCYKLQYIDQIPSDEKSGDMVFGTAIHLGIESYLEGLDGKDIFEKYWDKIDEDAYDWGRWGKADLKSQGLRLLYLFSSKLPHYGSPILEQRVQVKVDETFGIEGTPDFIGDYQKVPTLLDFKTSSQNYEPYQAKVSEQLYLYSWLIEKSLGIKVDQIGYIVLVKGLNPHLQTPIITKINKIKQEEIVKNFLLECSKLVAMEKDQTFTTNYASCILYGRKCRYWNICHKNIEESKS